MAEKKKYWLAQTAKEYCCVKEVEVDPNDREFFKKYGPWIEESYEDAREHIRKYIKRYIREIDEKIEKLKNERSELFNKLFNL